jgi:GNAT superfamily N-acetyltransferase
MSTESIPDDARAATGRDARAFGNREAVAAAIEEELARLKELRPGLEARIDRASHLLVVHLSDPRSGTISVRIDAKRRCRFLVRSLTSGGIYVVEPGEAGWSCSCPDYRRRNAPCKHLVAAWCLRAADRRARSTGCTLCNNGWVHLDEQIIDSASGEVVKATNVIRCRRCTPVAPGCLTDEELRSWMSSVRWKYAATMPRHPHEYHLKRWGDPETFEAVVKTIWSVGYDRRYLRRPWRSLDIGGFYVWVHTLPEPSMSAPLGKTVLINRALRVQRRLV